MCFPPVLARSDSRHAGEFSTTAFQLDCVFTAAIWRHRSSQSESQVVLANAHWDYFP